mgnify:CR=1 FL=1
MKRTTGESFLRLNVQVDDVAFEQIQETARSSGLDPATIAVVAMHYAVSGPRKKSGLRTRSEHYIEVEVTRSFDCLLRQVGVSTAAMRGQLIETGIRDAIEQINRLVASDA